MARKILTIGITINLENYENLRLEVQGEIGADGDTEELVAFLDGMLARLGHGDEATAELVDAYRLRVLAMPGSGAAAVAGGRPSPARKAAEDKPAQPVQAAQAAQAAPVTPQPASRQPLIPAAEPAQMPREPRQQPEAPKEEAPREEKPATVRVTPEARAAKPAARAPAQQGGAARPAPAPASKKGPAPLPVEEAPAEPAPREPDPKAAKPKLAEGEVACEACGTSITRNQEKLSKLLTGKSLCKRCMNP
jgi:hypothetical protein